MITIQNLINIGGAVAKWSKALQLREKNKWKLKDPRFAPPIPPLKALINIQLIGRR